MNFLKEEMRRWRSQDLHREVLHRSDRVGRFVEIDGRRLLNFSSNNYLGLAGHPQLVAGARKALDRAGTTATASRLVVGNLALHEELEEELARWHGLPGVRLFGSGFQANLGLISSLAGEGDLLVSDRLNHASMIDGCRMSRAQVRVAEHLDLDSVSRALVGDFRRKFVVTDSVFSMDGDLAPLAELRALCNDAGAHLIVDEAHALGVLGPEGSGLCAEVGVVPDALVGGMGKSLASFGGYVAGTADLADFLLNRARSLVFSTALPPAVVGASLAAVRCVRGSEGDEARRRLSARIRELRIGLEERELLAAGAGRTAIFPVVLGDAAATLRVSQALLDQGILCRAIRPPTVAPGSSRLRVALSACLEAEDIALFLSGLDSALS